MTKKIILSGYRGSIAHNLHIPAGKDKTFGIDDTDFFELYCFPIEYYLSLDGYYHTREVSDEIKNGVDTVSYEIRKAFHLLSECNPNVLLFLYNRPQHYRHISAGGKLLLKHRKIFLSRERIKRSFIGYASDQLNKLMVTSDRGFMGPRRRRLFDKFGFDTKRAMTAIRLMIQGKELLETGSFKVFRDDDRDFLLEIKKGERSVEEISQIAAGLKIEIETAYKTSSIPEENNKTKINELLVDILTTENDLQFSAD
jgi:predicted nucleotidyltransferase